MPGLSARGLPELDDLKNNGGRIGDGYPDKYRLDGKSGPRSDEYAQHLIIPVFPPTARHGQRNFPQEANEENEEKRNAEGTPVDERSCSGKKLAAGTTAPRKRNTN